ALECDLGSPRYLETDLARVDRRARLGDLSGDDHRAALAGLERDLGRALVGRVTADDDVVRERALLDRHRDGSCLRRGGLGRGLGGRDDEPADRKSTRLNSSHVKISYAVFCLKKKKKGTRVTTR